MLRKEGAIHCVSWSPAGDEFICIFGESPPEACIFNLKCEVTFSFGEAPRNTVSWSPHGRFLALAGFGNMAGELSFWDRRATPQVRDRGSHSISASLTYDGGHLPAAQVPLDGRGAHDRRIWLVARLTPLPHCHPLPAPTRRQRLSSASPPAQPQRNQPRQTGLSPHPVTTPRHPTPSPHPVTTPRHHTPSSPRVATLAGVVVRRRTPPRGKDGGALARHLAARASRTLRAADGRRRARVPGQGCTQAHGPGEEVRLELTFDS